jgi:hypothetical protein
MKRTALVLALLAACSVSVFAADKPATQTFPSLDHVFLIMMENHGYGQIYNNPNARYINAEAAYANLATNYFAIAHPSSTNYLEVIGGSNFGVLTDNETDWHNANCTPNIVSGITATDNPPSPNVCPIASSGTDAATIPVDVTNEVQGAPGLCNLDCVQAIKAAATTGQSIGDQLTAVGKTWKSYQESLPVTGADNVGYSDGFFTDLTDFSKIFPQLNPPLSQSDVVKLYAVKHNPFVYFQSVQEGTNPGNSLANTVAFDGPNGVYADLQSGNVPNFAFIVPNQCNDMHGRGNAGAFCNFDPNDNGTQNGLNPALIIQGDITVQRLLRAIKASPAWTQGHNAIVIMWDENDYSYQPNINQVMLIVDTNYGTHGTTSNNYYNHHSLLKSLETGFGLPCLNHACDAGVSVMSDLFAAN